ncbi:MAG: hypothetical protein IH889_10735 [Planctomycetes bacterium]|nr:hypothetical protein [Planctomycetota bacterium]
MPETADHRHHLLALEGLAGDELVSLLDQARRFHTAAGSAPPTSLLAGRAVANLFFEDSTRTRCSFTIAAKRLGALTIDLTGAGSSLSKGESFLDTARTIHRGAGLVLIVDCMYHLGYVAYGIAVLKKSLPIGMIPTPKDALDFFQDLLYWFGRSSEKPQFGRFSYREKFDYWAIFWGMPVIALSGLILMFPVLVSKLLPSEAVSVALVAHSDEALLAVLWIFIVHFFFVHLNPRFFPLNRAMFTGKMPRRLYAEEHPLELAALDVAQGLWTESDGDPDDERAREAK